MKPIKRQMSCTLRLNEKKKVLLTEGLMVRGACNEKSMGYDLGRAQPGYFTFYWFGPLWAAESLGWA
jgi:hypothetical protein